MLAVGDAALGFLAEVQDVLPETYHQPDCVHKTANVHDALPRACMVGPRRPSER